jgi:hypothetical protein
MTPDVLMRPSFVWVAAPVLGWLMLRSWRVRRWPTETQVVELVTLSAGFYAGATMLLDCLAQEGDRQFVLFLGASLLLLAASRGIWTVLNTPRPCPGPHPPGPAAAERSPTSAPPPSDG